jgi:4-hydroxybenzoyl-CoA reductase subunit beta
LLQPTSLAEAVELLSQNRERARLLAGGTDLLAAMKLRVKIPDYLVSLNKILQLDYIQYDQDKGWIKIGPLTTLKTLQSSPLIQERLPTLARAATLVGAKQIQNMATIGGNICLDTRCWYYNQSHFWRSCRQPCYKAGGEICHAIQAVGHCYAVYSGDLAPCLIVLGTQAKIKDPHEEKIIALEGLYTGVGKCPLNLAADEIVAEILIPLPPSHTGSAYQKLRDREAIDFPLAGVAVCLSLDRKDGICTNIRIVLNAVGSAPRQVTKAEELLTGKSINEDLIEEAANECFRQAHPVPNTPNSPAYRKKAVPVLFRRALQEALSQIH